jgi:hypothetical protein
VNRVTPADLSPWHKPDLVDTPYLSVFPDISLPSLERYPDKGTETSIQAVCLIQPVNGRMGGNLADRQPI